ncbi:hypothetical protein D3C72_2162380 [compost metagenome]
MAVETPDSWAMSGMRGLRGLLGLGGFWAMVDSIKNHHLVCWYLMDSADSITGRSMLKGIRNHQYKP